MAQTVQDVMTRNPRTLDVRASIKEAAQVMRDAEIGDVIVTKGDRVAGIVTDRDIVIRAIADGKGISRTTVGKVTTNDPTTLTPTDSLDDAMRMMRDKAVRRLPVVDDDGRPLGILSLGDLAMERDPNSVLGNMSAAPPNS
jgi:CBS domain-containing protein